jgi:arylsulfatase A-like enzyme
MRPAALLFPLLALAACGRERQPGTLRNVLVLTLDTTRADHLEGFGAAPGSTPALARLAAEGVRFRDVTCAAPTTLASHAALFTGTYPHTHGVARNGYVLDPANVTAAELFREAGFRTAAVLGSFVLERRFGLDQGFELYDQRFDELSSEANEQSQRSAGKVTAAVLEAVDTFGDERWFCFAQYFDPHKPYAPPVAGEAGSTAEDFEASARFHQERRFGAARGLTAPVEQGLPREWLGRAAGEDAPEDARLRRLYAAEVAYLDQALAELLAGLEQRGVLDETLVVLTADHGESFTEHHDLWNHGLWLYQTTVRVPLCLRFPDGRGRGQVFDEPVSGIDLLPTLCELVGLPRPARCEGTSLVPLLDGAPLERGPLFCEATQPGVALETAGEWGNRRKPKAIRAGRYKLLWSPYTGSEELFDLAADPLERRNLLDDVLTPELTAVHERLARELRRWSRAAEPLPSSFDSSLLDQTIERLSGLGYTEGGAPEER